MQILLVDEDQTSLERQRKFMTALGHKVHCSPNLDLAIKKLSASFFDISIIDESVLNIKTRYYAKQLKGVNSKIPLIITTNKKNASNMMKLLKFRPFDVIIKPLDIHTLLFMQLLVTDRAP